MGVADIAGPAKWPVDPLVRRPSVRCRGCHQMVSLSDCVQQVGERVILVCPHCGDHERVGSTRST
jgi:hypothetical protein